MADARAWQDEYTLLCERCGYVVEGLPAEGACPECGKPIAESLPERRVGTVWQSNRPGLWTLARSWHACLFHPLRTLDQLAPGMPTRGMRSLNAFVCAFLWLIGVVGPTVSLTFDPEIVEPEEMVFMVILSGVVAVVTTTLVFAGVLLLTEIEARGLELISRQRGFRITPAIARRVCDHGGVGWAVCGGTVAVIGLGSTAWHTRTGGMLPAWGYWSGLGLIAFGFLFFETFAWLGLRRLKYANRTRPHKLPASGAES
jgi:hypothetical protein